MAGAARYNTATSSNLALPRPVVVLMVMCCLPFSAGCLHRMGLAHSSLSPRTASTDPVAPLVVRSQDNGTVQAVSSGSDTAAGGHSIGNRSGPRKDLGIQLGKPEFAAGSSSGAARLLRPDFQRMNQSQATYGHNAFNQASDSVQASPNVLHSGSAGTLPKHSQAQPELNADAIRRLMNQGSSNPMSEGRVLADKSEHWSLQEVHVSAEEERRETVAAPSPGENRNAVSTTDSTDPSEASGSSAPTNATSQAEAQTPPQAPSDGDPSLDSSLAEPTMLDRLRGMYTLPESEKLRPRWRLPSPFSVFSQKDAVTESPVTTVEAVPPLLPEQLPSTEPEDSLPLRQEMLQALIAQLKSDLHSLKQTGGRTEDRNEWIRLQQDLRLLQLLANDSGQALSSVAGLPSGEQEFWQELMLALAQYRDADGQASRRDRLTTTVGQLRSAVRHLTPETKLVIRRIDLCSEIYSFGRIEPFPSHTFDPGSPVLLYVEVGNFSTETTPDGGYETDFSAQLQFFAKGDSEPIESTDVTGITDVATSERFDYFQTFELTIPSHLEAGAYEIRLKLADQHSKRTVQAAVPFQVR